jgi:hypothetical protein
LLDAVFMPHIDHHEPSTPILRIIRTSCGAALRWLILGLALCGARPAAAEQNDEKDPPTWCTEVQKGSGWEVVVCIDATKTPPQRVVSKGTLNDPIGTLLPINRSITIVVRYDAAKVEVSAALTGDLGVEIPGVRNDRAGSGEAVAKSVAPKDEQTYVKTFAPRVAGAATIELSVTPSQQPASTNTFTDTDQLPATTPTTTAPPAPPKYAFEALVPKVYSGVLRLGVGVISVGGLGHDYTTRKLVGGTTSQVVDLGGSPMAFEVVVGYAPFVLPRLQGKDGRTFTHVDPWSWRISPYLGLGVLSTNGSESPQWLRSMYLGAEVELAQGCSIAFAAVGRRTEGLADALTPGMEVANDTDVTRTSFDWGWGLVFNFTPDFFTFATDVLPK